MLIWHTFLVNARCPINGTRDTYTVRLALSKFITVEEILSRIHVLEQAWDEKAAFQEDVTEQIGQEFGATVETKGSHSGVETTVLVQGGGPK